MDIDKLKDAARLLKVIINRCANYDLCLVKFYVKTSSVAMSIYSRDINPKQLHIYIYSKQLHIYMYATNTTIYNCSKSYKIPNLYECF